MQQRKLAFEVDHINEEQHSGWSVLVRGAGAEVSEYRRRVLKRRGPTPWAIGPPQCMASDCAAQCAGFRHWTAVR
jgi:hypothetical protein